MQQCIKLAPVRIYLLKIHSLL